MTELNTTLKVTFRLDEIKQLVIDNIEKAHDISNLYCLSKCTDYFNWHFPLIEFYKENKTMQPTMADKLCFVILLSYPKHIIESLNDISDIKLFSHDNTDFIYIQELSLNHAENETGSNDCICSYKRLHNIHFVQNKYSGITLQVGSECITKHNLISREEIKKFKETEKLLKEKQKEIKECKPIGFYEAERKRKAEEKKRKAEEEKKRKAEEKKRKEEEEKKRKEEEEENKLVNKTCLDCNEEMAVKQTELWRTYCTTCYRRVQDTIKNPPKCNCGLNMIQRTIKRECINKGRKGFGCAKFPNGCKEFQIL